MGKGHRVLQYYIFFSFFSLFIKSLDVSMLLRLPLADSRKAGRPVNPLRIVMSHERGHRPPFPPAVMNNSKVLGGGNGISTYIDVLIFMHYIVWFNKKFSCLWTDGIR